MSLYLFVNKHVTVNIAIKFVMKLHFIDEISTFVHHIQITSQGNE